VNHAVSTPSDTTYVVRRGLPLSDARDKERLAMTTTKIMTTLSLVAAVTAATVVAVRHVKKTHATAIVAAPDGRPAADAKGYEEVGHYAPMAKDDPSAVQEATAKAQSDERRAAAVARARELDAEVAAGPVNAPIARRANGLVEGVRRLALPGMDHLAAESAECGRGACRIRIPSELVEPLKARFASNLDDLHLFAFDPQDEAGTAIVYVLPEPKVSSAAVP
jgi:hypothetical protein